MSGAENPSQEKKIANLVVVRDGRILALIELTQLKNNYADVVSDRDEYLNDLKVFGEEKRAFKENLRTLEGKLS